MQPKDAASLIIIRLDGVEPRVLMGTRTAGHIFLPGKLVFPGGRLDKIDCNTKVDNDLGAQVYSCLLSKVGGVNGKLIAKGLAVAAIREAFEETGIVLMKKSIFHTDITEKKHHNYLNGSEYLSAVEDLIFVARAITPPNKVRRFDTRFFAININEISSDFDSLTPKCWGKNELENIQWFSFSEAKAGNIIEVTAKILDHLDNLLIKYRKIPIDSPVISITNTDGKWIENVYSSRCK